MARAPVPSVTEFRAQCVRPEAFANIPDATIAAKLTQWTDRAASYTGKHTRREIVAWDAGFTIAIFAGVGFDLMTHRGFNPAQGADTAIKIRYEKEWTDDNSWMNKVARAEVEPFVDDGATYDEDAIIGSSAERADDFTRYRSGACGCT